MKGKTGGSSAPSGRPVQRVGETVSSWHRRVKAWKAARDGVSDAAGELGATALAGLTRAAPTRQRAARGARRGRANVSKAGGLRMEWDLPPSLCQLYAKGKFSDGQMRAFDRFRLLWLSAQGSGGTVRYAERVAGGSAGGVEHARAGQLDALAEMDALRSRMPEMVWRVLVAVVVNGTAMGGAVPADAGFGSLQHRRVAARVLLLTAVDVLCAKGG